MTRLVLRAARLFDGQRSIDDATVIVDGGRIAAVEPRRTEPPLDADALHFGDATLLPGLIDTHVHLGFDGSADPVGQMKADDDGALLLRMRLAARRSLAAGVTTVRDLGDRGYLALALRDWFRGGNEIGPEIQASGPPLTVTGGHCHFMGGQADDEGELRRGVRERATRGVDVIKVMVTGGNMTAGISPMTPQYTVAELAAVVDEAHRFGRSVTPTSTAWSGSSGPWRRAWTGWSTAGSGWPTASTPSSRSSTGSPSGGSWCARRQGTFRGRPRLRPRWPRGSRP